MTAVVKMHQWKREEASNAIFLGFDSEQVQLTFDDCPPLMSILSKVNFVPQVNFDASTSKKSTKRKTGEKCRKDIQLIHDGITLVAKAIKGASQTLGQDNLFYQTNKVGVRRDCEYWGT